MNKHYRSIAWGYHQPGGCVLWWAVQPTQHLHIVSELDFEQLDESELATQMKARERSLNITKTSYTVGSPAIVRTLKQKGLQGEWVGDRLMHYGVCVIPADDDTLNGWKRCQSILRPSPDGTPWLTIDPSCVTLVRAIQSGLRADRDPNDVRDAHPSLVAFRYGAMSRPSPDTYKPPVVYPVGTPGYVMQQHIREGRLSR